MKLSICSFILSGMFLSLAANTAIANPLLQRGSVDIKSVTLADVNEEIKYHMNSSDAVSPTPIGGSFIVSEGRAQPEVIEFEGCDNLTIVSEATFTVECKFDGTFGFSLERSLVASYAENRIPMGKDDRVSFGVNKAYLEKKGEILAKISFWPAIKSYNGDSKMAVTHSHWVSPAIGN
jgi:hypothetical protein